MAYQPGKRIYHGADIANWTEEDFATSEKDHAAAYLAQRLKERVFHEWKERKLLTSWRREYYKQLVDAFGETCQRCGSTANLAVDHKTPVSKGGYTTFENLQLLCRTCNSQKSDMLYYEWIALVREDKL